MKSIGKLVCMAQLRSGLQVGCDMGKDSGVSWNSHKGYIIPYLQVSYGQW